MARIPPEVALVSGALLIVGAGWFLGEGAMGGPWWAVLLAVAMVVPGIALAGWGTFRARRASAA